jgi:putative transposase
LRIDVPRDRQGSIEPQIIGKHERRLTGFDQKSSRCMRAA